MTAGVVASKVREKREKDNHLVWSLGPLCQLGVVMLCNVWLLGAAWYSARVFDILFTLCFVLPEPGPAASQETEEEETGRCST